MPRLTQRTLKTVAAAAALAGCLLPIAEAESRAPKLLTQDSTNRFRVRPAVVSYTGDGTGFLGGSDGDGAGDWGHLRWQRWNHGTGYARGVAWLDNCDPSCAEGTYHAHRARVRVARNRHGRYTRMTIRFRWGSGWRTDRRLLRHTTGYWYWALPL